MRYYPECNELVATAISWDYGSVHTHEEIAAVMGLEPRGRRYYEMVSRANKKLLEHQKMLKVLPKIGYKTLEPEGYTDEVVRQVALSKGRLKQAGKVGVFAPVNLMQVMAANKHRNIMDRHASYLAMLSGATVEVKLLNK